MSNEQTWHKHVKDDVLGWYIGVFKRMLEQRYTSSDRRMYDPVLHRATAGYSHPAERRVREEDCLKK